MDHIELWDKAKALMREELANVSYTTWIEQPLKPVYVVDDKLALEVISDFNERTIRARYLPMITEAVSQAAGREMTIELMSVKERIEWQERQKKEDAPAMQGINMFNPKSTFDTFVVGSSNRFAHAAALAVAEQPGMAYNPLFLYGGVGLGKTHLLLAIKNELAEKSPEIKVKYANSQAYLDDLMTEFDRQKKSNAPIMQAYHGVDVLIIDDIQNIIGKRASVDYFFQLMDEFIRNNKKVVIAADRAPKDLSMDERLTSRFNAGMLCLVAEPSYEMKYKILQRYYENTIVAAPEAGDDSLLAAYGGDGGRLTDEHFKHMAEVSGTNIRELESFCERCAGEAGDREREGGELTFDDIDAIASQYFDTSAKKINVQTVQSVIEEQYGVTHEELIGPRRNANIAKARHIAIYLAIEMCEMTTTAVGAEFGNRNHSTVSTSYKKVQKMIQEDCTVTEDLKSLRDKITLRS